MRVGIATDHGGIGLKEELAAQLKLAGHEVVDFVADSPTPDYDSPDFVIPLAHAVAAGRADRGVAICGNGIGVAICRSGVGVADCINKIRGVCDGLIHDHFSARLDAMDDPMNILFIGGRTFGPAAAWDLVQTFLTAEAGESAWRRRYPGKAAALETGQELRG